MQMLMTRDEEDGTYEQSDELTSASGRPEATLGAIAGNAGVESLDETVH
jgi:hypothetical protein